MNEGWDTGVQRKESVYKDFTLGQMYSGIAVIQRHSRNYLKYLKQHVTELRYQLKQKKTSQLSIGVYDSRKKSNVIVLQKWYRRIRARRSMSELVTAITRRIKQIKEEEFTKRIAMMEQVEETKTSRNRSTQNNDVNEDYVKYKQEVKMLRIKLKQTELALVKANKNKGAKEKEKTTRGENEEGKGREGGAVEKKKENVTGKRISITETQLEDALLLVEKEEKIRQAETKYDSYFAKQDDKEEQKESSPAKDVGVVDAMRQPTTTKSSFTTKQLSTTASSTASTPIPIGLTSEEDLETTGIISNPPKVTRHLFADALSTGAQRTELPADVDDLSTGSERQDELTSKSKIPSPLSTPTTPTTPTTTTKMDNQIQAEQKRREQVPVWVKNEDRNNCMECQSSFNWLRTRHHCRMCGDVYCGTCSDQVRMLPAYLSIDGPINNPDRHEMRVCIKCSMQFDAGNLPVHSLTPRHIKDKEMETNRNKEIKIHKRQMKVLAAGLTPHRDRRMSEKKRRKSEKRMGGKSSDGGGDQGGGGFEW